MKKVTISLFAAAILLHANEPYEITITSATKSEQSIKDVTSNVEVITGAELEEKHITTVLDALRLSGISISQSGGIGQQSSFFMNGFSSGNTLVLIDGIKYNDPTGTEGQAQLEHLMVADIEQIEIIKGSQSGIWGANAVAGVINIITKKASKELKTNTNIEYGSNNTKKIGANISQKVGGFSYFLGANYIKTDGFSAKTPKGKNPEDYESDPYKNKTINAKVGYEITDSDKVIFNVTGIDAKVKIDRYTASDIIDEITQKNNLYKTTYQHNFNDKDYALISYAKSEFNRYDPFVPSWGDPIIKGNNQESAIDGRIGYGHNGLFLLGVANQKSEDEIKNKEIKSIGCYLTNSNIFDRLVLSESLRYDNYDLFNNKITEKIGAKYLIASDISVSANYGTAYKAPVLSQIWYNATTNLQPETTKTSDITLEYKHFKATYFQSVTTNLIEWKDPTPYNDSLVTYDSNWNVTSDQNTYGDDYYHNTSGKSQFKGYEISYNNEVVENFLLGVTYNQLSAKDKDGKDLIRRIKQSAKLNLDYYGIEKLHLGIGANYIGKRDDLDYSTSPYTPLQTGKYTLFSAVANYDVSKTLKTYLKIDNLTDRLYQEVYGYGTSGRAFYVGLNATF